MISLHTRPDFANPLGTVHGGIAATLLDSVVGCAVHTSLPAGVGYTTLEIKVNYIRLFQVVGRARSRLRRPDVYIEPKDGHQRRASSGRKLVELP